MPTNNPVPSLAGEDLIFNAEKLDEVVNGTAENYTDRLGVQRKTIAGISADADLSISALTVVVAGDFVTGTNVTARNQVVLWPISAGGDGREYRWAGALDKVVPPGSAPLTTGGISDSAWVYTADAAFEQALAAVGSAKLVGGVPAGEITQRLEDAEEFIDGIPANYEASGTASTLIATHNSSPSAHPELSAFITAEADRAELAADAAELSAGVYSNTAAGIAGTTEGQFFSVPSLDNDEFLLLYRHDAGPTATLIKTYPSAEFVTNTPLRINAPELIFTGNNASFDGANDFVATVGSPSFDTNTTVLGELYVSFAASTSQSIGIAGPLEIGKTYFVSVDITKQSGSTAALRLGLFSSGPLGANEFSIYPVDGKSNYLGYFTASTANFDIGVAAADNPDGMAISIDNLVVVDASTLQAKQYIDALFNAVKSDSETTLSSVIKGTDSNMDGPNNWTSELGAPSFNVGTTVAGKMYFNVSGADAALNKAVRLPINAKVGELYRLSIKARITSGTPCQWRLGNYTSGPVGDDTLAFTPTATEAIYSKVITISAAIDDVIYLGVLAAENPIGGIYEFDDITLVKISNKDREQDLRIEAVEVVASYPTADSFFTEQFLQSLSKFDKPLTKVCVAGDSLMANYYGGVIPDDEGVSRRPIRLDINSIPRRIYDLLSWNKAEHRRIDDSDWVRSGTWTAVNDTTVWEPQHPDTLYHASSAANSYVEIVVPSGNESFAFICQKMPAQGIVDITLNGGSIAAYGPSSVDLARANTGVGDNGNPYCTVLYTGLPAGVNTIRISKRNDTNEVRLWGGFYWTGQTMVLHNVAHGGHTMAALIAQGHMQAEVLENDFDAILFELTVMNEASAPRTVAQSQADLQTIFDTYFAGKDIAVMTPFPFGDNGAGTNFYALYDDPTMQETCDGLRNTCYKNSVPFVNVFNIFKKKIENRGGTLEGGETGLWYTTDGQHPNEVGAREWFNVIRFIFEDKPIRY